MHLFVYMCGATKVLYIGPKRGLPKQASARHRLHALRTVNSSKQRKSSVVRSDTLSDEALEDSSEQVTLQVMLRVPQWGLSLVDYMPREVAYVCGRNTTFFHSQSDLFLNVRTHVHPRTPHLSCSTNCDVVTCRSTTRSSVTASIVLLALTIRSLTTPYFLCSLRPFRCPRAPWRSGRQLSSRCRLSSTYLW